MTPYAAPALSAVGSLTDPRASGLLLVGALGAVAFTVSLVTRRLLPISEVVAFLVIGLALGPSAADVLDAGTLESLQPVTAVALGAMVYLIGERLQLDFLRPIRHTLVPVAIAGNLATFAVTFAVMRAAGLSVQVAYLLGALAPSTAPVTVRALVAERRARGAFTDHLLASTALNNVTAAVLFGLGAPFVFASLGDNGSPDTLLVSLAQLLGASLAIGVTGGALLRWVGRYLDDDSQRFVAVWVVIALAVGGVRATGTSVVITTLVLGMVVANGRDTGPLFEPIRTLEAPIFLVFFVVTGADVKVGRFLALGGLGAAYILSRSAGRVLGTWAGLLATADGRRTGWRYHAGLAQLPYAGMAVGLASFTVEKAANVGASDVGSDVAAVILGAVFLFEIVSPLLTDRALTAVGEAGKAAPDEPGDTAPQVLLVAGSGSRMGGARRLRTLETPRGTVEHLPVDGDGGGGPAEPGVDDAATTDLVEAIVAECRAQPTAVVVVEVAALPGAAEEVARRVRRSLQDRVPVLLSATSTAGTEPAPEAPAGDGDADPTPVGAPRS